MSKEWRREESREEVRRGKSGGQGIKRGETIGRI